MKLINNLSNYSKKIFVKLQDESIQKKIKRLNLFFCIISFVFIFRYLSELDFVSYSISLSLQTIFVGVLFYFSNMLLWTLFMNENYKISLKEFVGNWSLSKVGKYFPSGILIVSARLNQKLKTGQNSQKIFYGLLEEHFIFSLIGLLTTLILLILPLGDYVYVSFPVLVFLAIKLISSILSKFNLKYVSFLKFKYFVFLNVNLNLLFVYSVATNFYSENATYIALLYYLSLCIGLFFVGVPAGIGIREALFIFLLGTTKLNGFEIEFLVSMRVSLLLLDILFFIFGLIYSKFSTKNN